MATNAENSTQARRRYSMPPQNQKGPVPTHKLRRSKRFSTGFQLLHPTSPPPPPLSPAPPAVSKPETYTEILTSILDATDAYLGLSSITHRAEVPASLRDWIERLHELASPSDLETVLKDVKKYVDAVLAGLEAVTDVASENRLWELELRLIAEARERKRIEGDGGGIRGKEGRESIS